MVVIVDTITITIIVIAVYYHDHCFIYYNHQYPHFICVAVVGLITSVVWLSEALKTTFHSKLLDLTSEL